MWKERNLKHYWKSGKYRKSRYVSSKDGTALGQRTWMDYRLWQLAKWYQGKVNCRNRKGGKNHQGYDDQHNPKKWRNGWNLAAVYLFEVPENYIIDKQIPSQMQKVEIGKKIRDLDERESFEILWVKEIHIKIQDRP